MFGSFKLRLAVYFLSLAVLPLAAAFWGFGAVLEQGAERGVDGRLGAELRAVLANYEHGIVRSRALARQIAERGELQQALAHRQLRSIAPLVRAVPNLRVQARGGSQIGARSRLAASSRVQVRRGGIVLGSVVALLPLDHSLMQRLRTGSGVSGEDRLVVVWDRKRVVGSKEGVLTLPPGRAVTASLGGSRYRALASGPLPEQARAQLAVLAPAAAISGEAALTRSRLLLVLLGALIVCGMIAFAEGRAIMRSVGELAAAAAAIGGGQLNRRVPVRGRDEFAGLARAFNGMAEQLRERLQELRLQRTRLRDSIKRFGEVLEATHEIEQLLPVIAEAAAEAADAAGAIVIADTGTIVEIGDVDSDAEQLEIPIAAGQASFGTLILVGRSFADDDVLAVRSLVAQAAIALENARLHKAVEEQARVDGLTGLANRRRCEEVLERELARAERYETPLAVILCDIDDFKAANDSYGHALGDEILQGFAAVLRQTLREVDIPARWGGEEFLVVLPETDLDGGVETAERIRASFASWSINGSNPHPLEATVSLGVASYVRGATQGQLVAEADRALYMAKRGGKNRVEAATETSFSP